eukprot:Pgem_evm1s11346
MTKESTPISVKAESQKWEDVVSKNSKQNSKVVSKVNNNDSNNAKDERFKNGKQEKNSASRLRPTTSEDNKEVSGIGSDSETGSFVSSKILLPNGNSEDMMNLRRHSASTTNNQLVSAFSNDVLESYCVRA